MATTSTTYTRVGAQADERALIAGRRRARITEALIGLAFVAPVAIIAIVFELFPVIYGFYISLQEGEAVPKGFVGLENFVEAIGSLAYMIALAIAVIFVVAGYALYNRALNEMKTGKGNFYPYLIPGFIAGPATLILFTLAFRFGIGLIGFPLIAILLSIGMYFYLNARKPKTDEDDNALLYTVCSWGMALLVIAAVALTLFVFSEMFRTSQPLLDLLDRLTRLTGIYAVYVYPLIPQFLAFGGTVAGVAALFMIHNVRRKLDPDAQPELRGRLALVRAFVIALIAITIGYVLSAHEFLRQAINSLSRLTTEQIREVTRIRLPTLIEGLSIWPQVHTMLLGIGMVFIAYVLWNSARKRETTGGMLSAIAIAICLMVGGWLFIGELPQAAAAGDQALYDSLLRTVTYAMLTVPVQLTLGLGLAYLLFNEVKWGKSFFRLVYFMPYIAPTVATAAVFAMIFSTLETSPANQILNVFGLPPQEWLRNPKGVFQILADILVPGTLLPSFLVGPSLPLLSAILYAIWVFSGYNAVVFMAGLGTVPKEMYEAAEVDGAGRWATFRHIVFPLISPTTFFLTVLAVIGTFRAFTHIWVLRREDARGAMDTATVYIFEIINTPSAIKTRPYAAALSFLLFGIILILTIIQNRLARDRVFYG